MTQQIERGRVKIHWTAPNGREYKEIIMVTLEQYRSFLDKITELKNSQNVEVKQ